MNIYPYVCLLYTSDAIVNRKLKNQKSAQSRIFDSCGQIDLLFILIKKRYVLLFSFFRITPVWTHICPEPSSIFRMQTLLLLKWYNWGELFECVCCFSICKIWMNCLHPKLLSHRQKHAVLQRVSRIAACTFTSLSPVRPGSKLQKWHRFFTD